MVLWQEISRAIAKPETIKSPHIMTRHMPIIIGMSHKVPSRGPCTKCGTTYHPMNIYRITGSDMLPSNIAEMMQIRCRLLRVAVK